MLPLALPRLLENKFFGSKEP